MFVISASIKLISVCFYRQLDNNVYFAMSRICLGSKHEQKTVGDSIPFENF